MAKHSYELVYMWVPKTYVPLNQQVIQSQAQGGASVPACKDGLLLSWKDVYKASDSHYVLKSLP